MHGIPHGKWTWFNTSGKKERIVTYKKGIKDGPVSIWNDQGKKAMTGTYINDKKNGEWKWHSDNKGLDSLIQFSENKYMGKYQIWHVNGQKAVNGEYQNGIKIGEWKWYTINGNLDSTKIFSNGMLNGPVQFYYGSGTAKNESKIKSKMTYSNGKLPGEKIDYYLHFAEIGKDLDQRNYMVSYEKISDLGFQCNVSVLEGIDELIKVADVVEIKSPFSNV